MRFSCKGKNLIKILAVVKFETHTQSKTTHKGPYTSKELLKTF